MKTVNFKFISTTEQSLETCDLTLSRGTVSCGLLQSSDWQGQDSTTSQSKFLKKLNSIHNNTILSIIKKFVHYKFYYE